MKHLLKILPPLLILSSIIIFVRLLQTLQPQNKEPTNDKVFVQAEKIVEECLDSKLNWRDCFGQKLGQIVTANSFPYATRVLHSIQDIEQKTGNCHLIAHYMSNAATQKNPENWKGLLGQLTTACTGGFIHGVLEAHMEYDKSWNLDESTIPDVCSLIGANISGWYCYHTMGHLLMVNKAGDVGQSIEVCRKLPEENIFNCATGVFMENETRTNLVAHNITQKIPFNWESTYAQEKICKRYQGKEALACWQELAHFYQSLAKDSPQEFYNLCGRSSKSETQDSCFLHGIIFIAQAPEKRLGNKDMRTLCNPFSTSGKDEKRFKRCMTRIVSGLISSSTKLSERITKLCIGLDNNLASYCEDLTKKQVQNSQEQEDALMFTSQ